ncbi:MAG: gluconate 2-dehydrogenase subunit 3 family protein [Chloroflexota bacterium]
MLSERQVELLEALVNRIIPADEFAGGWEGGVRDYLLRQFERDLKALLPIYRLGLDALDGEARAVYGRNFDSLAPELQDELLRQIEAGRITTPWTVDPLAFFRMVIEHSAEGYYSDPGNGGNPDTASWAMASWTMIGFQVRG